MSCKSAKWGRWILCQVNHQNDHRNNRERLPGNLRWWSSVPNQKEGIGLESCQRRRTRPQSKGVAGLHKRRQKVDGASPTQYGKTRFCKWRCGEWSYSPLERGWRGGEGGMLGGGYGGVGGGGDGGEAFWWRLTTNLARDSSSSLGISYRTLDAF